MINLEPAEVLFNALMRFLMHEVDMSVAHHIHDIDHGLRDRTGHDHFGKPRFNQVENIEFGLRDVVFTATIFVTQFITRFFDPRYTKEQIGPNPVPVERK